MTPFVPAIVHEGRSPVLRCVRVRALGVGA